MVLGAVLTGFAVIFVCEATDFVAVGLAFCTETTDLTAGFLTAGAEVETVLWGLALPRGVLLTVAPAALNGEVLFCICI